MTTCNTTNTHTAPTAAEAKLREVLPGASKRPWLLQRNWNRRDGEFVEVVESENGEVLFGPPTVGFDAYASHRIFREGHAEANAEAVVALGNAAEELLGALDALRAERKAIARALGAADDCEDLLGALTATLDARRAQGKAEGRAECVKVLTDAIAAARANIGRMPPAAHPALMASAQALQAGVKLMERLGRDGAQSTLVVLAR
jgi:hypothetical protein